MDLKTGSGLFFFWLNLYIFGLALHFVQDSFESLYYIKWYAFIYFSLAFLAALIKYIVYLLGSATIFFPGFFTEDGNHLAFISGIFVLVIFYCFALNKSKIGPLLHSILLYFLLILHFSCSGTGATLILFTLVVLCIPYLILTKKYFLSKKILFLFLLSILSYYTWNFLPRTQYSESPFFNKSRIVTEKEVFYLPAGSYKSNNFEPGFKREPVGMAEKREVLYYNPSQILGIYKNFNMFPASVFAHITLVYSGFILFLNKPLLGWGLGSFNEAMHSTGLHQFFTYFDPSAASVDNYPAHNMYTNYLSETGILGFIGYLGIFVYLVFLMIKKFRQENNNFLYFIYLLSFLYYLLFTIMYNLHEEFVIIPLLLMSLITPLHKNKKSVNFLQIIKGFVLKYDHRILNYTLIFILMTSYILEKRLIPINANLNYVRYSIVLFVLVSFVKKLVHRKRFKTDIIFYILISISIFKSISILFAYNKFDSVVSSIYWLGLSFLYLTFFNYDLSKKRKDWVWLVIIAGAVNAFFSYVQIVFFYFFNLKILNFYGWVHPFGFRVTGLSYDANHLAAFILLPIFICSYFILTAKNLKFKIISLLLFLYFIPVFYFSSSRSALIGISFTFILYILFFILKPRVFNIFAKIYFFLIPTFFISIYLLFYPTLALKDNQQELGAINTFIFNITKNVVIHGRGLDGSAFAHFSLVYSSFKLQAQHYFLGTGAGNFAEGLYKDKELSDLFRSLDASAFDGGNFPAHSMYGEALGEGGFIGFILFISLLFLILNKYLKVIEKDRNLFPFFIYFYSICFFMLFYNINEEFFWVFTFLGLFLVRKSKQNLKY